MLSLGANKKKISHYFPTRKILVPKN